MSSVQIRPATPDDLPALLRVWSLTYNSGEPYEDEQRVFSHSHPFVAEVGGEVVGAFGVMPMTATRGEALMKSAGVLAVAVSPNSRGTGVGRSMMRWLLHHYRAQGFELAALYAFRESYYRDFGYEVCGKRIKITVEAARFPKFEQSLPSKVCKAETSDAIAECYARFAHLRSGVNIRNERQWERVLVPTAHRTLYTVGDPVEAYAVVQHKVAFWEPQWIEEVVWSTRAGYESILAVIRGIGINKSTLSWHEPSDSPFMASYVDHGTLLEIERHTMFRTLDVPGALGALKPEEEGEFTLSVADEDIAENRGPWLVRYGPEGVTVESTRAAEIELDSRAFTQCLMGEPSFEELRRNGRLRAASDSAAIAAGRLLTPSTTYCPDFF